jgi:two-component system response regulator AtoC
MTQERVLLVDDEANIRRTLSVVLHQEGYEVDAVADGREALRRLPPEIYDFVITDLRMPGVDGMAVLEEVKRVHPETLVVMMSAYGSTDLAIEAVKRGAVDYIAKPFSADELVLLLRKATERERLRRENARLRRQVARDRGEGNLVSRSPAMQEVIRTIEKVASHKSTVLITGESGSGKEMVATTIHRMSLRREAPFVTVNCGAIPANLLESELFGYIKGAFTDAGRNKKGLFEEADGGTLFLDEIGELPPMLQVKLLRALQDGEVRRLGDVRIIPVDVRVIAATARKLEEEVRNGGFREDLFYRLNVIRIEVPALRERPEDIEPLAEHFREMHAARLGRRVSRISAEAMATLVEAPWPGNVRELENVIERAVVLAEGGEIDAGVLPLMRAKAGEAEGTQTLSIKRATVRIESELIRQALARTGGNRTRAARLLEISHRALLYKLKRYGIA